MSERGELLPCKNCKQSRNEIQEYYAGSEEPLWKWFVRCCLNCGWQPEAGTTEMRANQNWNDDWQVLSNPELVRLNEEEVFKFLEEWRKNFEGWNPSDEVDRLRHLPARSLAQAICQKFGKPNGLDREEAEKYAKEIWKECSTTDAIASYLQRRFGQREVKLPELLTPDDKQMSTNYYRIGWNKAIDEVKKLNGLELNPDTKEN